MGFLPVIFPWNAGLLRRDLEFGQLLNNGFGALLLRKTTQQASQFGIPEKKHVLAGSHDLYEEMAAGTVKDVDHVTQFGR